MDAAPPRPVSKAPGGPAGGFASVGPGLPRLRRRREFLAANRGARIVTPAFILLVSPRKGGASMATDAARAGFTVSRKVGNAVVRNRARRRLREIARLHLPALAVPGADHVFIARAQETERPFATLAADLRHAMAKARRRLDADAAESRT